jgi:tryptophanase
MADRLIARDIPMCARRAVTPVFIDAAAFCPHLKPCDYPGIGLVRKDEIPASRELVRLAFPRRVYTQSHFDYVIEVLDLVWRQRDAIPSYRITKQAPFSRIERYTFLPI